MIDKPDPVLLRTLLKKTDEYAVQTVLAGQGGPFGASLHVYDLSSGALKKIGDLAANAVLETGMGSAHAEDQALTPENVAALKDALKDMDKDDAVVIFSSSGQSCPACHNKEEILARTLIAEGLLKPHHMIVTYGATYEDTKTIAGFNDEPYHIDMQKTPGKGMIKFVRQERTNIPSPVAEAFAKASGPIAVVFMPDGTVISGYDKSDHDLRITSEVSAIRNASHQQKSAGKQTPWDLDGATLYTTTRDIGPLAYAESQWANIGVIITIPHAKGPQWQTQEAPEISNQALFQAVAARPYNNPHSVLTVFHIEPFDNKAQKTWRLKLNQAESKDDILYNGLKP